MHTDYIKFISESEAPECYSWTLYIKEEDVIVNLSVILQVTQRVFKGRRCDTDTVSDPTGDSVYLKEDVILIVSKFASDPACDTVALKSVGLLLPFLFYLVFSHK